VGRGDPSSLIRDMRKEEKRKGVSRGVILEREKKKSPEHIKSISQQAVQRKERRVSKVEGRCVILGSVASH